MFIRFINWLFPNSLKQWEEQQARLEERSKRIKNSFTKEQHEAADRIVAMHQEDNYSGSSHSHSSSNSSGSRSDSSCTRFDD